MKVDIIRHKEGYSLRFVKESAEDEDVLAELDKIRDNKASLIARVVQVAFHGSDFQKKDLEEATMILSAS